MEALELYGRFVKRIKECEERFKERNRSDSVMRGVNTLPYTFMIPSSSPGRTGRGVTQSIAA